MVHVLVVRIGHNAIVVDDRQGPPLSQFMPPWPSVAHQVPDDPAAGHQGVGYQQPVTAPRHRLAAHQDDAAFAGQPRQPLQTVREVDGQRVVRVVLEALVLPPGVHISIDGGLSGPTTAQVG